MSLRFYDVETRELILNESDKGVFAISLVEAPAIEEDFVFLSKEVDVELKVLNEEKRLLIGYALIPDKLILRRVQDEEFNIVFSKETVRKSAENYLLNLHQKDITVEHESKVNGVTVVESWVTESDSIDKVALYGIKPIVGGWAVVMKADNDEVWQGVKSGKYKGFSIEGKFSNVEKLTKESSILEQIIKILEDGEK
jgi:hypothetical protein